MPVSMHGQCRVAGRAATAAAAASACLLWESLAVGLQPGSSVSRVPPEGAAGLWQHLQQPPCLAAAPSRSPHLCRRLLPCPDRSLFTFFPPPALPQEEIFCDEFHLVDLRVFDNCLKVAQGCEHVFNLAADMGGMGFIQSNHSVIMYNNTMIRWVGGWLDGYGCGRVGGGSRGAGGSADGACGSPGHHAALLSRPPAVCMAGCRTPAGLPPTPRPTPLPAASLPPRPARPPLPACLPAAST